MASVEEAETYAATHKIAEALEAAVNACLASMPDEPFAFIAKQLTEGKLPSERPTATEGAVLKPELDAYLTKHEITAALQSVVAALVSCSPLPADPTSFMAGKLVALGGPKFKTVADVRNAFVDYFVQKCAHTHWPSSPVVPHDDPTLLFINAGMNQFKPVFLGSADPASAMSKLKRAANSQKCIRAGGKHNDLDDVGKDNYHHTFFEMLGNWSFGDYYKKEAIAWAWELLTEVYKIPKDRLYATYFEGSAKDGLDEDIEARDIWLQYLPPERVLQGNKKDNFWEMGDTGPCGPCSEIHYDRIGGRDAAHMVNGGCVNGAKKGDIVKGYPVGVDDPNVLEIWNNVFMQFNREKDGSLTKLPAPCVDTGMGLERVASILLGKMSNYDIDVFTRIFTAIQAVCPGLRPYTGLIGDEDKDYVDMAYRVVADHIRTLTFSITDGAVPSNEGRGYVLRRILRRAVRYGGEILKAPEGFFHQLVDIVVEVMSGGFPELAKNPSAVKAIIKEEEEIFSRTLKRGIAELDKRCKKLAAGATLPGDDAFKMYDTYGFPLDLTVLMCEEKGMTVDTAGYEAEMEKARDQAKAGGNFGSSEAISMAADEVDTLKTKMSVPPTADKHKYVWDSTGSGETMTSTLRGVINVSKTFLESADESSGLLGLVVEATPFYAEAGGQIADLGQITSAGGAAFAVSDVKKVGPYVLHVGKVTAGKLSLGDSVTLSVDYARRAPIAKNHTTTHMLNFALRGALGQACDQRGALYDDEKLRFDFAYAKPLTAAELQDTQDRVNAQIAAALPVNVMDSPLEAAKAVNGLRAVFGEQYPDPVRVVSVGGPGVQDMLDSPDKDEWATLSIEFCGGTHVANSSEAKQFALLSEEGLGRGVRRVLGVTFSKAEAAFAEAKALSERCKAAEALTGAELTTEVGELARVLEAATVPAADRKALADAVTALKKKLVEAGKGDAKALAEAAKAEGAALGAALEGTVLIALLKTEADAKALELAVTAVTTAKPDAAVLLLGAGKTLAGLAVVPKAMEGTLNAKDWVNTALPVAGGKGGGKAGRAQGAARDASQANAAEAAAKAFAAEKLSVEIS